jgi:hypothetical protein
MLITWTLVIFIVVGGPSIVVPGFSNLEDCKAIGAINVELINPKAQFRCLEVKTKIRK